MKQGEGLSKFRKLKWTMNKCSLKRLDKESNRKKLYRGFEKAISRFEKLQKKGKKILLSELWPRGTKK
jgi:hypothetical protein